MFFYLSQLVSFLLMPLTICLLFLLAGFINKFGVWKKRFQLTGFVLLLLFTNGALSDAVMNRWEPPFKPLSSLPHYEVGIVLTGVTNLSKTASDRTFFDRGADRATHAIQLYKEGKIKKILITGGQGFMPANEQHEARKLADFMQIAGVDATDLIVEDQARNTRENAVFTKDMLDALSFDLNQEFLLITSAFHMKRSEACFRKVGLNVQTYPVDYYGNDAGLGIKGLVQPAPGALVKWHKLVKEWMGLLTYYIIGYI